MTLESIMRSIRATTDRVHETPRRTWWAAFILLVLLGGSWALASPLYAGPDEPAHTIKAAAVVRGQLIGVEHATDTDTRALFVTVPAVYSSDATPCFAFKPTVPAACQHFTGNADPTEQLTPAGRYAPAYYAFVGLATLPFPTASGIYLVRLLSVILSAALLASAVVSLRLTPDPRFAAVGLAVAITPMVLYLTAVVSPSTMEIAGAIGAWTSGYVWVTTAKEHRDHRVLLRFVLAASALALARSLGPLWLFLMVVALLSIASMSDLRALVRSRATWLGAAVVAVAVASQLVWLKVASPLSGVDSVRALDEPLSALFRQSIGRAYDDKLQMIAAFGWLDTTSPQITYVLWIAAASTVVLLALALVSRRSMLVIMALIAAVVFVPALLESTSAPRLGFIWQGRYTLPLAVGAPLLGTFVAGARTRSVLRGTRVYLVIGIMLFVAQTAGFYQALRRYTVGEAGALKFWSFAEWTPPLPSLVLLATFSGAMILLLCLLLGPRPLPCAAVPEGRADV
jgi:hypothetical protein